MVTIDVRAKKWGDSIAIIIPSDVVKKEHICVKDKVTITIHKDVSLKDFFGCWKTNKTTQEIKDEIKKGWEKTVL